MISLKPFKSGQTSVIFRIKLYNSTVTTQAGLTGLTNASAGLIISTIADVEASATTYTQAGGTIQTITTLGTYAAPSASNIRFKEVDATNHPGIYEVQIADARMAVSNAKSLMLSLSGAANLAQADFEIPLITGIDPYMAAPGASGGLHINGSNAGTTTFAALTVTGTFTISGGMAITNSNSNTAGLSITGNGTGHGILATSGSGATGDGAKFVSAATAGHGFECLGNGTGNGMLSTSGSGATGDGAKFVSAATNGNGLNLVGFGTGAGTLATGGLTGNGAKLVGGGTSGDALITSTTLGHAFNLACTGANKHPIAGVVETSYDVTQCLQIILSAVAGKCSISSDTVTYRDVNDSANRIVGTTDGDGQRTSVTLTVA